MTPSTRRLSLLLLLLIVLGGLTAAVMAWRIGGQLYAPNNYGVGPPPADLGAEVVTFPSRSDATLHGWWLPGSQSQAGVVLMHGSGTDRRSMVERARMLKAAGYPVLLFDFQAQGESLGSHVTDGYLEAQDARAAVEFMRQRGVKKVGIIGFSLGAAAAVLGPDGPLPVDAMVLEALYPTIEEATADRIRLHVGTWGGWLYPLFTWQLQPRLGIAPAALRPIDRLDKVKVPVLFIAGANDRHTPLAESERLYAAASEPKQLWVVPNAYHEDFYERAPDTYRQRVLDFFAGTLRQQSRPVGLNHGR
ncbi:MAG: alpha/beta hydrolase [Candidatus Competibacteraceae bacterium]